MSQKPEEVVEGVIDALSGLKALGMAAEVEVMIGSLLFQMYGAVLRTKNRTCVGDRKAATAAAGTAMGATDGENSGISGLRFHFGPYSGWVWTRQLSFLTQSAKAFEKKEVVFSESAKRVQWSVEECEMAGLRDPDKAGARWWVVKGD